MDVVDGQQRLTTCCLYLSIILRGLVSLGEKEFEAELSNYLYNGVSCKLILNNETESIFFDLISSGVPKVIPSTTHQKRLVNAQLHLTTYLDGQFVKRRGNKIDYLKGLFDAITRKLNFSFYPIEVESEIGMTFELMNSRGKELSALELLKNYLMYWVYRNTEQVEKEDITKLINKSWKEVYTNIARGNGSEDQCLRIAWILYHSHTPKNWQGYAGFKNNEVVPIRDFSKRSKEDTSNFIRRFATGISEISLHYSAILSASDTSTKESQWLAKIKNAGNIANFLPLLVAARIKNQNGLMSDSEYIELLQSMEAYSFRVFLWSGKRSNAGITSFYRWASEVFEDTYPTKSIIGWIYGAINWYSDESEFRNDLVKPFDWYHHRGLLKYCLFEYEQYLLQSEGKGLSPKLKWSELADSTIEHILPKNPDTNSKWLKDWCVEDIAIFKHDIANLVLTMDNSHYNNFEFERKKGSSGSGHCYANSDIRQERKISDFPEWTANSCKRRRLDLEKWILSRWGVDSNLIKNLNANQEIIDIDEI